MDKERHIHLNWHPKLWKQRDNWLLTEVRRETVAREAVLKDGIEEMKKRQTGMEEQMR